MTQFTDTGAEIYRPKEFQGPEPSKWDEYMTSMSDLETREFEPLQYIIPGYVSEGVTLLAGKPKSGKSWMALDWCLAVATGGKACESLPCEQGNVFYLALEDHDARIKRRARAIRPGSDGFPDTMTYNCKAIGIETGLIDLLTHWHGSVEEPRMIVIDTLAKVRPEQKKNELQYNFDYRSIEPLANLSKELNVAIVIVHHTKKETATDPLDEVSGSTGLTGSADSVLVLRNDDGQTVLTGRGRDQEDVDTAVKLNQSGQWRILGNASEVHKSRLKRAVFKALKELGKAGPQEIATESGEDVEKVRVEVRRMAKAGEILNPERAMYELPPNT